MGPWSPSGETWGGGTSVLGHGTQVILLWTQEERDPGHTHVDPGREGVLGHRTRVTLVWT